MKALTINIDGTTKSLDEQLLERMLEPPPRPLIVSQIIALRCRALSASRQQGNIVPCNNTGLKKSLP